ncbi:uncharacterized protein LOC106509717 isoform X9 [Sus scrofa]|uniref:uncharacterized protein LOC106509717 isoform X9 n=1 Tax=Sus scrofa TaxID=9823 RepID=UPI0006B1DDE7|nr:uncharacterized protein LOC106509717 isoform X9 [Sus scrofa]
MVIQCDSGAASLAPEGPKAEPPGASTGPCLPLWVRPGWGRPWLRSTVSGTASERKGQCLFLSWQLSPAPRKISQCGFAQIWVEMHQRVDTFLQNLFEDNMQVAGHHPLLSPPGWGKDGLSEELLGAFDTQLENDDDSQVELALMKLEDGLSEDLLGAFDAQLENDDSNPVLCSTKSGRESVLESEGLLATTSHIMR